MPDGLRIPRVTQQTIKIAFLGTGIMGAGMAANLLKSGFSVTVWNRTPAKAEALRSLGASVAGSVAAAVEASEIICMCLTGPQAVEELVLDPGGLLASGAPGKLVIDHSTISPEVSRKVSAELAGAGMEFLDAPVTGGQAGARDGTLTIMVGGESHAFGRALPVLESMGRNIVHIGPTGSGELLKLVGNLIGGVTIAATIEGLALGVAGGLDLSRMLEVLAKSSARSAFMESYSDRLIDRNYEPGFTLANRTKDFTLALDAARSEGVPLPVTALTRELFASLVDEYGELDQSGYVKLMERLGNVRI